MANTDARDSDVSIMFKETLEAFGYQVILATDGSEAIALFKSNAARIDVVVVDVVMPG
jgi:CheY-like chemotaxis protein